MYSIYDGKRKVDNTMSDQIKREQQIEEESLTKNSLQIQDPGGTGKTPGAGRSAFAADPAGAADAAGTR